MLLMRFSDRSPRDQRRAELGDLGDADLVERQRSENVLEVALVDDRLRAPLRRLVLATRDPLGPEPTVKPLVEGQDLLSYRHPLRV
jgi:hypothetical protein